MDSSVFIALIIIALAVLIFVPVSLINRRDRRRKQLKHQAIIAQLSKINKFSLTLRDIWNDQLLGIDPDKKILVYCDLEEFTPTATIVHLSEIESGAIVKNTERIEHAGRNRTSPEIHVSDIGLELYSSKKEMLVECIFYDDIKNSLAQIPELTERARNWLKKLATLTPLKISDKTI